MSNILVIIADGQRPGTIYQSGSVTMITPALDLLYEHDVVFINSYNDELLVNAAV